MPYKNLNFEQIDEDQLLSHSSKPRLNICIRGSIAILVYILYTTLVISDDRNEIDTPSVTVHSTAPIIVDTMSWTRFLSADQDQHSFTERQATINGLKFHRRCIFPHTVGWFPQKPLFDGPNKNPIESSTVYMLF